MDLDAFWGWLNGWLSGPAGGLAAIVTGLFAIWGVVQTARDSREKSQPTVLVELRFDENVFRVMNLVVRNLGPTVARDVQLRFDPPLPTPEDPKSDPSAMIAERYKDPIETLVPGQALSNTWYLVEGYDDDAHNRWAIGEDTYTAHVSFRGRGRRRIEEKFVLNSRVLRLENTVRSSNSMQGRVDSIDRSLREVRSSLSKIASKVGR